MNFFCEGKTMELQQGATPEDIWNQLAQGRPREAAVLADCDGETIGFHTPFQTGGTITWIPLTDQRAYLAYRRTLVMLLVVALKELYGDTVDVEVKHSIGNALYCEFTDKHVPLHKECQLLEERMHSIVVEGRKIDQISMSKEEALTLLKREGRKVDAELLAQVDVEKVGIDRCGSVLDYYLGPLLPDMSFLTSFELQSYAPGFLVRYPAFGKTEASEEKESALFAKVFLEAKNWSERIGCKYLAELNEAIDRDRAEELISMAEALHEKRLGQLADSICQKDPSIRLVCIAGPSSSGKTTFMKRLITHLKVNGARPVMLSLDDFFKNRDELRVEEWENLEALDLELFESVISRLLEGQEVYTPRFNFLTGEKEWSTTPLRLEEGESILIEGLHALNSRLTYFVPGYECIHVYLSALTQLSINHHNRISTSDTRLLRRLVRDARFRGYTASQTLGVWKDVRRGEEENIFLFQERADTIFNSALLYEISVLKTLAVPLLETVRPDESVYGEARRLLYFLEPFRELDSDVVPPQSLLREFVGREI